MSDGAEHYPTAEEVDAWCADVLAKGEARDVAVTCLERETYPWEIGVRHTPAQFVEFRDQKLGPFYAIWQPAPAAPAPLLLHVPGYGSEMSTHPELAADGYNVLHVNPLGHATPDGPDESKRVGEEWTVLPDTVRSLGERGYVDWLAQAVAALRWALERDEVEPSRVGVFGTSQGGGGALLVGSIFRERGVRAVAADLPFLTNFQTALQVEDPGAYGIVKAPLEEMAEERPEDLSAAWKALGFADTMSHAHRLTMPVLLTAGTEDATCPPATIRALFEELPGTRSYTELSGQGHAYTPAFLQLARAWFRLHV